MRRLLASLAIVASALVAQADRAEATSVWCQTFTSGTYTASSSCTKSDHNMNFIHRVQVQCRNTSTGLIFYQYGPWRTTLLAGNPNWSTGSCPVGSYRIGAWANWRIA